MGPSKKEGISGRILAVACISLLAFAPAGCGGGEEQGSTPPAPPPEVVAEDDFSDPESGWETGSDEFGGLEYADGAYQVSGNPGFVSTAAHLGTFVDSSVEADVTQLEGPEDSQLGIVCRSVSEEDVEYLEYAFYLTSDGAAGIGRDRAPDGAFEPLLETTDDGTIIALGPGATNRLRADCAGPSLALSVNGERLLEVEDEEIPDAGEVGFLVSSSTPDEPVVARFDNFVLREP